MNMAGAAAESLREEAARRGVSLYRVRSDRGYRYQRSASTDGRVNIGVRLAPELVDRLRDEAAARDVSVNWLVKKAIEDFLGRVIPADEFRLTR